MQELTGKQARHLRSLGQKLAVLANIGKAGVTEGVLAGISTLLDRHELIKIHMPAGTKQEREQMAAAIAHSVGAACTGVIGRTALLYRPNESLPYDKRIALP